MADHQKPLLDKDHASLNAPSEPAKPAEAGLSASLKAVHNQVVFARRIHNMITIMFLIVALMVYLVSLSPEVTSWFSNIWIVFTVLVLYIVVGIIIITALAFSVKKTGLTVFVLVFLTFSLGFFITYLGVSAKSTDAGLGVALTMALINLIYSILCQTTDERITTEKGIVVGLIGSLILTGGIFYYNYNPDELPIMLSLIYLFITSLYSAYIFLNIKGMADGAREAISGDDYMIAAVMVYLDFSIGLIIAIFREVCSHIAS